MSIRVESPFPAFAVPRVWKWIEEFRSRVADDFAPSTLDEFVALWEAKADAGQKTWGVYRDDDLGGFVSLDLWSPVCGITHFVCRKDFWGHQTTLPALEMAYTEIFETGLERTLSFAFRDNSGLIHLVKQIGGRVEGTHPKMTRRNGELVDMVSIGVTRGAFEAARAARQQQQQQKEAA